MSNTNDSRFENVYSKKVKAGSRRTYFFDVRKTRGEDFYVTLTESTKKHNSDSYERHKIFLYKEDFNRFLGSLKEVIDYVKVELMPDYDYEEFDRKQAEWELNNLNQEKKEEITPPADPEAKEESNEESKEESKEEPSEESKEESGEESKEEPKEETNESDDAGNMSW